MQILGATIAALTVLAIALHSLVLLLKWKKGQKVGSSGWLDLAVAAIWWPTFSDDLPGSFLIALGFCWIMAAIFIVREPRKQQEQQPY